MNIVTYVDMLNGVASPTDGEQFNTGKLHLELADSKLEAAVPDRGKWDGDAANAYAAQNVTMRDLAQKMQRLDAQMPALLKQQADAVKEAHRCCLYSLMTLVLAQGIALLLWVNVSPLVSTYFQLATVFPIASAVAYEELAAFLKSANVADAVDKLAADYNDVAQSVPVKIPEDEVPGAADSSVSSFEAVSGSMSQISAFPDMPTLASLVSTAGERVSPDKRALLSAFSADNEAPRDDTPGEQTPDTPASAPPSPLPPLPWQAAKLPAQRGQGAAAPAKEAATQEAAPAETDRAEAPLADGIEGAGAATGSDAGERAPIDAVAVSPGLAQPLRPLERIA